MTVAEMLTLTPEKIGLPATTKLGIACTGTVLLTDVVAELRRQGARVVVLARPTADVNESLKAIGLPLLSTDRSWENARIRAGGFNIPWHEIFDPCVAGIIWQVLDLPGEFDRFRHAELVRYNVQPQLQRSTIRRDAVDDYLRRLVGHA